MSELTELIMSELTELTCMTADAFERSLASVVYQKDCLSLLILVMSSLIKMLQDHIY